MMLVPHLKVLTPEEDEEQLIMRRMRNSVDELRRGYRFLILISILVSSSPHNVAGQVVGLQDAKGEDQGRGQQGHQRGH